MQNFTETAKQYLDAGLSVLPIRNAEKHPVSMPNKGAFEKQKENDPNPPRRGSGWGLLQEEKLTHTEAERFFNSVYGIGITGGRVSGNLEILDIDTKNDLTGTLGQDFFEAIKTEIPQLFEKLLIEQTPSGGFHILYRCEEIGSYKNIKLTNNKLARRKATPEEKEQKYQECINAGDSSEKAKNTADSYLKDLIETKAHGGYIACYPTPHYSLVQGSFLDVPTITPEERNELIGIALSFDLHPETNDFLQPPKTKNTAPHQANAGDDSPFTDFNNRGDVIALLEKHGWTQGAENSDTIYFKTASTKRNKSADYFKDSKNFYVWTKSTVFKDRRSHSPVDVFIVLELNGDPDNPEDVKRAAKELLTRGYGKPTAYTKLKAAPVTLEGVRITATDTARNVRELCKPSDVLTCEHITNDITKIHVYYDSPDFEQEIVSAIDLILSVSPDISLFFTKSADVMNPTAEEKDASEPLPIFRANLLIDRYAYIYNTNGTLTSEQVEDLLDEAVSISAHLPRPTDRDRFLHYLLTADEIFNDIGVTQESLQARAEEIRFQADEAKKELHLTQTLTKAAQLTEHGKIAQAIETLDNSLNDLKLETGRELIPAIVSSNEYFQSFQNLPPKLQTGFKTLDRFAGIPTGATTLIAGRPSHGKTTVKLNLILNQAELYADHSFYFFTYEEPKTNLAIKMLNIIIDADLSHYYNEKMPFRTNYEFLKMYFKEGLNIPEVEHGKARFAELINSERIVFIDKRYTVEDLSAVIGYLSPKKKLGAIYVDYAQKVSTTKKTQDKRTEVAHVSSQLLQIGVDTGLPMVIGAQLNRANAGSPTLEGLKEAGNLEEDANTVISVYNESRDPDKSTDSREVELELKALKNREGVVNKSVVLTFDRWTGKITDRNY